MKIRSVILILLLSLLLTGAACAEERIEAVEIVPHSLGADNKSMGCIYQTELTLSKGDVTRINMQEVFAMYPEHSGIYGVIYSPNAVTITPDRNSSAAAVSGTGVVEFAFPDAEFCTLQGSGTVYGYFLPVPYFRLSASTSLEDQPFDTDYLTTTAVGHANMFMLADPHVFVFQESIPASDTVYKFHSRLGPLPAQYQYLDIRSNPVMKDAISAYSFVSEQPVLIQCCAVNRGVYATDTYCARPMEKIVANGNYELWCYQDYQPLTSDFYTRIQTIFDACIALAEEEFLQPSCSYDPILMVLLGEELHKVHAAGLAVTDEMTDQIGFRSLLYFDTSSWENISDYMYYLFAHEIGHVMQSRSLAYNQTGFASWFLEGFATYFGEKACKSIGIAYTDHQPLSQHDISELDKFHSDLIFGISTFEEYMAADAAGSDILIAPHDRYSFGCNFMYYLEDKYGAGFFKGVSESFYENWYKGHESRFFKRRNEMNYNVDLFFDLIKQGLDAHVYLDYPDYAAEKFGLKWVLEPDFILPDGLTHIGKEAFMGVSARCIRLPDSLISIDAAAFANCPNLRQLIIPPSVISIEDSDSDPAKLTIVGESGSYAQSYAERKGYTFYPTE